MAGGGLIALLDDVATIADDVATLTLAATKKTTGVVTDDMAVTAEQAIGLAAAREIPVVLKVARGSFINKAVFLAPGALLLNAIAPWSIHPILMGGGLFLAYEGVEKLLEKALGHGGHAEHDGPNLAETDPVAFEQERVSGAIRTDLVLSGEIIALTLGEVAEAAFITQVVVLYGVSVIITVGVYGMVGVLLKIDDVGAHLALRGAGTAALGRAIVAAAPKLLHAISWIGTIAMLMVGGHILLEGIPPLAEAVHHAVHDLSPVASWLASIGADVLTALVGGAAVVALMATGLPQRLWALRPWLRRSA